MSGRHPVWYAFIRWLVREGYFKTHGGFVSVGEENMPRTGGVIVAPVHLSHLDPPAVACATRRRLRFMAKEELFHHPIFGALIHSLGAYRVKRGETDTESIRKTISLLGEGEAVLIFPEGARGDGKTIQPMSRGVAMLAKRTGVPIVPVGIVGTNIVMPQGKFKGQKHRMTVSYGKPFTYAEVATSENERENRENFLREVQTRIVEQCADVGLELRTESAPTGSEGSANPLESRT